MTIEYQLIQIASQISNRPINTITLNSSFQTDLRLDSLSLTELIIACEEEFQIEIDLDHPATLQANTLKDLYEVVILLTTPN
jgi:acyl carrier protein